MNFQGSVIGVLGSGTLAASGKTGADAVQSTSQTCAMVGRSMHAPSRLNLLQLVLRAKEAREAREAKEASHLLPMIPKPSKTTRVQWRRRRQLTNAKWKLIVQRQPKSLRKQRVAESLSI